MMVSETKESLAVKALLKTHPNLMSFVLMDGQHQLTEKEILKSENFFNLNSAEQLMVKLARNIWNGEGEVSVYDVITKLDETNYINFLTAMTISRL